MKKFSNFSGTLILREVNFGLFRKAKNCNCNNFEGFEFWFLERFHTWKCQKFLKIQNSELLKWSKWKSLGVQNDQTWFRVKSEWQNYPEISILCISNQAAKVCKPLRIKLELWNSYLFLLVEKQVRSLMFVGKVLTFWVCRSMHSYCIPFVKLWKIIHPFIKSIFIVVSLPGTTCMLP